MQLALNVSDLEASVASHSTLFGLQPHKRRPGFADFAITKPPLKLVLIEAPAQDRGHGVVRALNHLGVEVQVQTVDEVVAGADLLRAAGLTTFDGRGVPQAANHDAVRDGSLDSWPRGCPTA